MNKDNPYTLKGELLSKSQVLTSAEADFDLQTWTFHAPHFVCGGGDYVVIAQSDWNRIWNDRECVAGTPEN